MGQPLRPEAGLVIRAEYQAVVHRAVRVGDDGQVGVGQPQDGEHRIVAVRVGGGIQVQQGAIAVVAPVRGGDDRFEASIVQS